MTSPHRLIRAYCALALPVVLVLLPVPLANAESTERVASQSSAAAPPKITKQPESMSVVAGRRASFAVQAVGADRYQWKHLVDQAWVPIKGATSAALTLSASAQSGGKYRVRVYNAQGRVSSRTVTLTVFPRVLMIGHRGDVSKARPEQTMYAFKAAHAAGADMIEFDVRWTSDQRMVLMHDPTMDRTTNCTGSIESHTYAEVQTCDAGSWRGRKFADARVPTFESVLAYANQTGMSVNAEIKTRTLTTKQAMAFVSAISDAHMVGRAIMASFEPKTIEMLRSVDPEATVPSCSIDYSQPSIEEITAYNTVYFNPRIDQLTPEYVAELHRAGLKVFTGSGRTYADYARAEELHVDGLLVNSVDKYRGWLRKQV